MSKICLHCGQLLQIPPTLHGRLQFKRCEKEISRRSAAAQLNCSIGLIGAIESGKSDIRLGQLKILSNYYKTDISFFLGDLIQK